MNSYLTGFVQLFLKPRHRHPQNKMKTTEEAENEILSEVTVNL